MNPRIREIGFALLRLVSGLLFACHGAQKLFGALGATEAARETLMVVAGVIEFFGGVCVATGLFTRASALLASGEMAVAYSEHAPKGFWPIENGGEPAVLYCFVFLAIAAARGGELGLDGVRRRRREREGAGVSAAVARARKVLPQDPWSARGRLPSALTDDAPSDASLFRKRRPVPGSSGPGRRASQSIGSD